MKINLFSAIGDPRSLKTWSGTPYNIYQELAANDNLEDAYISYNNNLLFRLCSRCLMFYSKIRFYSKKDQMMMGLRYTLLRRLSSYSANKFANKSTSKHFLHFGTFSLPYIKKHINQFHYCLIDATWNMWLDNSTDIELIKPRDRIIIEKLEVKAYDNADHIFTISDYVKQNLIEHYNVDRSKITVVGTGTGIIQPFYGVKDYKNRKILFVAKGRFEDKGGELVLKALDLLLEKYPNIELSIVGQNNYKGLIDHPNIKTYGFIPLNKLQELFDSHSLFLMPAINEPWGLVYIEAMLCKMPIIGINKNSFPELSNYNQFGTGIDGPNYLALSNAIDSMLCKPDTMENIGLLAQEFALKNYTWNNTASKILSIFNPTE